MTLFEFAVFSIYFTMITFTIVLIQILNPGKLMRESLHCAVEESLEKFDEKVFEEPESDSEEEQFDPAKETFTMTENPMLRHRNVHSEEAAVAAAKPIELDQVD